MNVKLPRKIPANIQDIIKLIHSCHGQNKNILVHNLVAPTTPIENAVQLDLRRINHLDINPKVPLVKVGGGKTGQEIEEQLAPDYTIGWLPSFAGKMKIGDFFANFTTLWRRPRFLPLEGNPLGLKVIDSHGEILDSKVVTPRSAAGPDLKYLFCGWPHIGGIVVEVILRLYHQPGPRHIFSFGDQRLEEALDRIRGLLHQNINPLHISIIPLWNIKKKKQAELDWSSAQYVTTLVLEEFSPTFREEKAALLSASSNGQVFFQNGYTETWPLEPYHHLWYNLGPRGICWQKKPLWYLHRRYKWSALKEQFSHLQELMKDKTCVFTISNFDLNGLDITLSVLENSLQNNQPPISPLMKTLKQQLDPEEMFLWPK